VLTWLADFRDFDIRNLRSSIRLLTSPSGYWKGIREIGRRREWKEGRKRRRGKKGEMEKRRKDIIRGMDHRKAKGEMR
jgi:hypothetical protein